MIANRRELFDAFLGMLNSGEVEIVGAVWRLVEGLEENEEYMGKLLGLELADTGVKGWEEFLRLEGEDVLPRTCYCMYMLARVVGSGRRPEAESAEYKVKLMKLNGFQFVIAVFLRTLERPKSKINCKTLIYCLKVMDLLLDQSNVNQYFRTLKDQQEVWKSVWDLLQWICTVYPTLPANQKVMDHREEADLVGNCVNLHCILVVGSSAAFGIKISSGEYLLILKDGTI